MASVFGFDIFWTDHISKNYLGRQNLLCQTLVEINHQLKETVGLLNMWFYPR